MALTNRKGAFGEALAEHLKAIFSRNIDRFAATLHHDVQLVGPTGSIILGYVRIMSEVTSHVCGDEVPGLRQNAGWESENTDFVVRAP